MALWFPFPISMCLTFGIFDSLPLKLCMLASPLVVGVHCFSVELSPYLGPKHSSSGSNAPSLQSLLNPWLLLLQAEAPIFEVMVTVEILKHLFGLCDCDTRLTQTSVVMSPPVSTYPRR